MHWDAPPPKTLMVTVDNIHDNDNDTGNDHQNSDHHHDLGEVSSTL